MFIISLCHSAIVGPEKVLNKNKWVKDSEKSGLLVFSEGVELLTHRCMVLQDPSVGPKRWAQGSPYGWTWVLTTSKVNFGSIHEKVR